MSGAFYIDGVLQPDPLPCRLPPGMAETLAAEKAERDERARIATARIHAEFAERCRVEAERDLAAVIEQRSRAYETRPYLLDKHFPNMGLRTASPKAFIARVQTMIEQKENGELPRWFGMGGESVEISLRAALLLGERMLKEQEAA